MSIKVKGKVTCPECHKERCWKKGQTPSRTGVKQRYVCFDCGRSFFLPPEPKPAPKKLVKAQPVVKKGGE